MTGLFQRFRRDERGTVAVLFSLMALPVIGIVASAIDYGHASHVRSRLQNAGDAALSAGASHISRQHSEIEATIRAYISANLSQDLRKVHTTLEIAPDKSWMELRFQTKVPTTILSLVGVTSLEIVATSRAEKPKPRIVPAIKGIPALAGLPDATQRALEQAMQDVVNKDGAVDHQKLKERAEEIEADTNRQIEEISRTIPELGNLGRQMQQIRQQRAMHQPDPEELRRRLEQLQQRGMPDLSELGGTFHSRRR